ncbi:MAG: hypothetical protein F6K22_09750 [Okeania sp. SIO2F4]|uniref:hypothetical protein n=1 Tax=Okeania sp. SIO2F4 TaxID=2607790 RepID=UPI0014293F78|nr:hypothetical protein [Okeania sp. SIO2F4]NES03111.1 hypothetical protein [Okeania sp. SIO2F4]
MSVVEYNEKIYLEYSEKLSTLYSEIYPYVYWIIYNYPDPKLEEIKEFKEKVGEDQFDNREFLNSLKQQLIQLMLKDPRLSKSQVKKNYLLKTQLITKLL